MAEYVKRADVKNAICCRGDDLLFIDGRTFIDFDVIKKAVINTPTADVEEVKHGEWIFVNHSANYLEAPCGDTCNCSICGYEIDVAETYFKRCPMCEAKMDGGKAE